MPKLSALFSFILSLIASAAFSPQSFARSFYTPTDWNRPIVRKAATPREITKIDGSAKPRSETKSAKDKPAVKNSDDQMRGYSSWYGPGFHGKKTANGEIYDQNRMTAAHRILPMGTLLRVSNTENRRSVVVRINDRGPYKKGRILDLSHQAAKKLDMLKAGVARVSLEVVRYPESYDPSKGLTPYKQTVVQIAVFSSEARAKTFKRQLSDRYSKFDLLVDNGRPGFYHVLAGPYSNATNAKSVSEELKKGGITNFVRSFRK